MGGCMHLLPYFIFLKKSISLSQTFDYKRSPLQLAPFISFLSIIHSIRRTKNTEY